MKVYIVTDMVSRMGGQVRVASATEPASPSTCMSGWREIRLTSPSRNNM